MSVALSELSAIVLAAGNSARMDGGDKLSCLLAGKSLIAHSLETISRLGLAQVVVVTSAVSNSTAQIAVRYGCDVVENLHPDSGMGRSLAIGVSGLRADVSGCFVCLADMPFVRRETFAVLADALTPAGGDCIQITAPAFDGRRGHPVLFANGLFGALSMLTGDVGARKLIQRHPENAQLVIVDDPGVVFDIDTAAHLAEAERRAAEPD